MAEAQGFVEHALALDPGNIEALIGAAIIDFTKGAFSFTDNRPAHLAAAEKALTMALSMVPQHALAHAHLGAVKIFTNRAVQGIAQCEQALALDRNLAAAHCFIGIAKFYLGRSGETEAHIYEAFRLSPRDVFASRWMLTVGIAKLHLSADAEAVAWLRRSIEANRNFPATHFHLAGALALIGSLEEGHAAVQAGLALDPTFTIRRYRASASSDHPTFLTGRERTIEGMRIAGVPEG
jgi:tetratricopeptide (TPR) repeat protein